MARSIFMGVCWPLKTMQCSCVVDVGAVLEEPVLPVDGHGDHPVVLPGGMVHPACVALVLPAELALGVPALGGGPLAAAMALGSFSGLERLMVMSRSPYSVEVTHFMSLAMR